MNKNCECCGKVIYKKNNYSYKQFEGRRFCSMRCKGIIMKPATLIHNRKHSQETKNLLSTMFTGRIGPNRGKMVSDETKQKIREKFLGDKSNLWKDGRSKDRNYVAFFNRQKSYRRRHANGSHSLQEWESVKTRFFSTCPGCRNGGINTKLTEDHIVPLSRGGSNNIANIQPLCQKCNSRKGIQIIKYELLPI